MATARKTARNMHAKGEPALLTSRDNRWLKEFRVALRGGLPTENGFVGVEGVRLVGKKRCAPAAASRQCSSANPANGIANVFPP